MSFNDRQAIHQQNHSIFPHPSYLYIDHRFSIWICILVRTIVYLDVNATILTKFCGIANPTRSTRYCIQTRSWYVAIGPAEYRLSLIYNMSMFLFYSVTRPFNSELLICFPAENSAAFFRDFFVWILLYLKLLWPSLTCHIKTTSQRLSEISYYLENKKQKWEMQLEYSRLVARAVSRWIVFDGANGESNRRQKIFARIWPKTRRWQNQSVFLRNKLDCTRLKSTTWSVWSQLVSGIQVSYSQLYSR